MSTYHELAEAMRKGAALRPQCFDSYFVYALCGASPIASCALGAAYEGKMGAVEEQSPRVEMRLLFPDVAGQCVTCPVCRKGTGVLTLIAHVNDDHHWTREAIADWLCTLDEPQVQL